jgi:MFS family permease
MSSRNQSRAAVTGGPQPVARRLLPFSFAAFLGFLAVGIPLPVLPDFVNRELGFGPILVGAVVGLQSLATLLTRQVAGRSCDVRGPKRTSLLGFAGASAAGVCYLASWTLASQPILAFAVLVSGRLLMGLAESLFITALVAWSIARVGPAHAGQAMAWSGIAMYGALAIGAPLGTALEPWGGFAAVAIAAMVLPGTGALLVMRWLDAPIEASPRTSFIKILGLIWAPGLAMAFASSGVGTIAAFLALRYHTENWAGAGFALTGFGVAYIALRLLFGGLPDRIGGYRVAGISLLVEAAGQLLIWHAGSPIAALTGATLTGLGYSLVFPSLGIEAIRKVGAANRGLVLGAYMACFDLGLALAGPLAGVVAHSFDLAAAFVAAAVAAILALLLTITSYLQGLSAAA